MNLVEWLVFLASLDLQRRPDSEWLALEPRVRSQAFHAAAFGYSYIRVQSPDLGPFLGALRVQAPN